MYQSEVRGTDGRDCDLVSIQDIRHKQFIPKPFTTRVTESVAHIAAEPIVQIRQDGYTTAQAKVILGSSGLPGVDTEGINMRSGYFLTLHDTNLLNAPWHNDRVFKSNGKKAPYILCLH